MAIAAAVVPPKEPELPVIILGCQINGDQPASTMKRRLTVALSYLVAHPNSNCVVSGGTGSDEDYSEAYVMKKWLTENGISPERILSEDQSHNTEQNIKNSLQLLRKQGYCGAVAIATDNWHQLRASQWVKWEGASSYAVSCSSQWDLVFVFWLREMMADARLFLFHR